MFTKPVIFVVIFFILAALTYSSSPTFFASVEGKPLWGGEIDCIEANFFYETCCWYDDAYHPNAYAYVCQMCLDSDGYESTGYEDCKPPVVTRAGDVTAPLGEGVLEDTPTPTSPLPPPIGGGVLQQPTTTAPVTPTPPPLFGRNVPLQGGGVFGQQPAATAIVPPTPVLTPVPPVLTPEPPVPMFGSTQQQATPTPPPPTGGEDTQSRTIGTSPTGGCATYNRVQCIPCDLGLAGAACTPEGEWPPVLSTDEGIPQATQPPAPPKTAPPIGEIAPEAEQPEAEEQEEETQDDGQEEPNEGIH